MSSHPARSPQKKKPLAPDADALTNGESPTEELGPEEPGPQEPGPIVRANANSQALTTESAPKLWRQAVAGIGDMASAAAEQCQSVAILAPNRLVVQFPAKYSVNKSVCERPEQKQRIEAALAELTGQSVAIEFALVEEAAPSVSDGPSAPVVSPRERMRQTAAHPLVQRAGELFGATPIRIEESDSTR